ncbi:MAG: AIM24 family protein, partial [Candidatus Thalassarchaeum betae]|nr:AIM24 family protein [Candidatus Thalassoarchaea betae]
YGAIKEIEVTPNTPIVVDNGHLVAFTNGVSYEAQKAGSWKTTIFGGEAIVLRLSGSGRAWIQTRNIEALANKLMPFLPKPSN